jgi:hypothetical protein
MRDARIPIIKDDFMPAPDFWKDEFDPGRPVPTSVLESWKLMSMNQVFSSGFFLCEAGG